MDDAIGDSGFSCEFDEFDLSGELKCSIASLFWGI